MKINVIIDSKYKKLSSPVRLRKVARRALTAEKAGTKAEMGIFITGDDIVHRLNREYLDEDRPTDVLSFPMLESTAEKTAFVNPPDAITHLGEVIISYPQAVKQAEEHGHFTEKEIAILLVHGILHLLGYDHDIPARKRVMRAREAVILSSIEEMGL